MEFKRRWKAFFFCFVFFKNNRRLISKGFPGSLWLAAAFCSQSVRKSSNVSVTGINLAIWWNLANLGLTKKLFSHCLRPFWFQRSQLTEWSRPGASKESPTTVAIGFQINEPIQLEICVITAAKSIPDGSVEAQDGGIIARLEMAPFKWWTR